VDEILGWGPLEPLLQDNSINEILVNGAGQVWIERNGQVSDTDVTFLNDGHLLNMAARMAARMGRRLDRKNPIVDGRLPDGSRVNIVGPPCALHGTSITIRKLSDVPLKMLDLIEYETVPQALADFLRMCVLGKLNIVVAGGSGSGKTTLLNVLASFIPEDARIVTVEESAELKLDQRHVVSLETRPPDYETSGSQSSSHVGEVSMRHLVANALRMRAERVLVGEIRGGEVLEMLGAMNTGHDGMLATMRASTPRDAVAHLESMAMMSGTTLPARSVREAIASGIDLIIQIARLRNGTRRVLYVTEVRGMEGDSVALKDIFRWHELVDEESGASSGFLEPTGHTPRFVYRLQDQGLRLDKSLFAV
jgi:pilus assembly protein CpaF